MSGEDKSGTAKVRSAGPPRVRTMPGGGSIAGGAHRQGQVTNSVLGRWGGGHRGLPGSRPVLSCGPLVEPRAVLSPFYPRK